MKKVFVFPSSFGKFSDEPERILREAGLEVTKFFKAGMTEDEVIEKLQGYDAVILGIEPMTARGMEACPQLKIVSRYGVGMDNVDQGGGAPSGYPHVQYARCKLRRGGGLYLWHDAGSGPLHLRDRPGPEGRSGEKASWLPRVWPDAWHYWSGRDRQGHGAARAGLWHEGYGL